jgi:hypothetical protein
VYKRQTVNTVNIVNAVNYQLQKMN